MAKGEDDLDDLNQRIKFLKKEKQKIIDSRKARAEVKRLEDDIKALNSIHQRDDDDNPSNLTSKLKMGSYVLKEIVSELRNNENRDQTKDTSQSQIKKREVTLENEVDTARKTGRWVEDEKKYSTMP